MTVNEITERLEIEYPCRWVYKVIGADAHRVRQAILEVVDVDGLTLALSNTSSGGNWVSFNVEVTVHSDAQRIELFELLRAHVDVRMVL